MGSSIPELDDLDADGRGVVTTPGPYFGQKLYVAYIDRVYGLITRGEFYGGVRRFPVNDLRDEFPSEFSSHRRWVHLYAQPDGCIVEVSSQTRPRPCTHESYIESERIARERVQEILDEEFPQLRSMHSVDAQVLKSALLQAFEETARSYAQLRASRDASAYALRHAHINWMEATTLAAVVGLAEEALSADTPRGEGCNRCHHTLARHDRSLRAVARRADGPCDDCPTCTGHRPNTHSNP